MDIQRKAFEESNNVNPDWSFKFDEELQQYVAVDFEMTNQVDEFNEHWDTFRAGWDAKAQAVLEGFVLVEIKDLRDVISNAGDAMMNEETSSVYDRTGEPSTWFDHYTLAEKRVLKAIEAQEPAND